MIPRLHLFEIEDSPLLPSLIRDMMKEYLHWVMDFTGLHHLSPDQVRALMRDAADQRQPLVACDDYAWEVGEARSASTPMSVTFIVGCPSY